VLQSSRAQAAVRLISVLRLCCRHPVMRVGWANQDTFGAVDWIWGRGRRALAAVSIAVHDPCKDVALVAHAG
jgi:hypothetical protein